MDFNYETAVSRLNYRKIMRLVDPENTRKITKDAVIEFFSLPGFLRYEELVDLSDSNPAQEQKRKEYCAVSTNSDPIYMPEDGFKQRKKTTLAKIIDNDSDQSRPDTMSVLSPDDLTSYNFSQESDE